MSLTLTHIRQTLDLQEKVKVGAGEKIVKNERLVARRKLNLQLHQKVISFMVTLMVKSMQVHILIKKMWKRLQKNTCNLWVKS